METNIKRKVFYKCSVSGSAKLYQKVIKMRHVLEEHIIPIVCTPILYIILVPLLLPLLAINALIRLVVSWVLVKKHDGKVSLIQEGEDALYGHYKAGTTSTVLICITAQKGGLREIDLIGGLTKAINSQDANGLHPYEKLKKILVNQYGFPCWKENSNFDVTNHVRTIASKNNNGTGTTENEIKSWLSTLSENMDESKPQWEFILFPDFIGDYVTVIASQFILLFVLLKYIVPNVNSEIGSLLTLGV